MKITAAVMRSASAQFELCDVELRDPRPNEVVVRIVAAGLCHTDLIVRDQWFPTPLPAVLGHEGAGVVEHTGEAVSSVAPGDHVVLSYDHCGHCTNCVRGRPNYCERFWAHNFSGALADGSHTITANGVPISASFFGQSSFASHALVTERSIVKVDRAHPLELLGPLGCGIQTGAGAVLNTLRPQAGASLVVFGTGAVGLSSVMAAQLSGCAQIVAVDRDESRLAKAMALGATDVVLARPDAAKEVRRLTGGGVDYAVEATGVPQVLQSAMATLRQGGECALVGAAAAGTTAEIDISTLLFGRTLRGVIEGDAIPKEFVPRLLELHTRGVFPFTELITTYPFADINAAVADAESGRTIKPVLVW